MQELHNQLLAATDPLEIIEISDKILYERSRRYLKHTFLKGESLLSLGRFDDALSVFEQILEYGDDRFTGRAHNSIGFCYFMKNKPRKAESEFKKAQKYCDESSLLLNSATLNMAAYYYRTNHKENTFKIFKELYGLDSSNRHEDTYMLRLTMSNNPQEFIEMYDRNIDESFPKDAQVMNMKAMALANLKRFNEAILIFEDALKYTDDKEGHKVIHMNLGFSYYNIGDLDKAICEFEKAREYSDDTSILLKLAEFYELANQKEKALSVLKEVSESVPDNQNVKIKIENLKSEINGKDLLNNFNSIQEAYIQKNIYLENNEYEKAIEVLDLIIEFQPGQPIPWIDKGYAYYHLGEYEEAIKCFDKSLEYNPRSEYSMYYKALVYMEEEDFENSQDMMVKALEISPDNAIFLSNYCHILIKSGKYEEAINIADKTLSIDPDPIDYLNKAVALENLNRLDEAIECYDNVLKINPNSIDVLNNKGFALTKLNRVDEAIECYDEALKINPNSIDVLNNKGFALQKLDRLDEAMECYDEALEINPNSIDVLNNKGSVLAELNRVDEAIECYDKALELDSNYFESWANKGFALEKLNRVDESIECYNKALELSPNNPHILNRLSLINAGNGDKIIDLYF